MFMSVAFFVRFPCKMRTFWLGIAENSMNYVTKNYLNSSVTHPPALKKINK